MTGPAPRPDTCPGCGAPGDVITWEGGSPPHGEDRWRCSACGVPWSTPGLPFPGRTPGEVTAVREDGSDEH